MIADTCRKSRGLDMASDLCFVGAPPKIDDIKFLGFIVPYPFNSSKLSPKILYVFYSYNYIITLNMV